MNIYINNKVQEIESDNKITDALNLLNLTSRQGVAVAVNNNIIPKAEWDNYILQAEDKITLIKAAQGG